MDKNFIKDNNLNEAVKRFKQIAEYKSPRQSLKQLNEFTFITNSQVDEDDNDDNMQQQQNADMNQQPQGMSPEPQNQDGNMNGQMDGNMQPQASEMPQNGMEMSQDNNAMPQDGGNMQQGDEEMSMGDDDMGFPGVEEDGVETEEMEPEDEVIDVDELTQSQETTEFKVDNVDDKLNKVLKIISKFNDAIEANDQKIEDLKKEFQKRNPTAEETLNLRSLASYPFSERPDEYWKKQQQEHPNYNVISDNDVSTADEQKEFEIRKGDIDNFNERDIMKSLGESHIKLSDFLQFQKKEVVGKKKLRPLKFSQIFKC